MKNTCALARAETWRLRSVASALSACMAFTGVVSATDSALRGEESFDPAAPKLFEGDILVSPAGFRGIGSAGEFRRWRHGEVPFVIDAVLPAASVDAIYDAVDQWNTASGITLSEVVTGETPPLDHLVFTPGTGCASWVGRQGGEQEVWIGPSCTDGSVMHEIGHALGLEHEHTRADRDAHIEILWNNILPEKRHNFAIAPADTRALGAYDLESIMHYGPTNFSIDGSPTLVPRDAGAGTKVGQRVAPSLGDLEAIAELYASDLALSLAVDDERAVQELTLFVTNQHRQGAHDVRVIVNLDDARIVTLDDGWRCAPHDGELLCRLPRLDGNASSKVILALSTERALSSINARLNSKTPDLDASNNGGVLMDDTLPALATALPAGGDGMSDDAVPSGKESLLLGSFSRLNLLSLFLVLWLRRRTTSAARRSAH